jgi:predicted MFS family arabinose efflux permease
LFIEKQYGCIMPQTLSPKRELWLLLTLAGIQFTSILDFMIMMPLGPQFTQLFHISDAQFGLLVSAYTLAAGASGLLASTYIDKLSRKRLLLFMYSMFALATLACGLAPTYELLMTARIAAGIFGGVLMSLSQTIVGDVIPFERRGRAMGIIMTSFSIATVAGVPLGLFMAVHLSWHAPFIGIGLVSLLLAGFAAATLPPLSSHLHLERPSTFAGIQQVLSDPNHLKAFVFSILIMFAGFTMIPYITLYMQLNVGMRPDQIPLIYLCGGVVTFFTARIFGRLTDSYGKAKTFRVMAVLVVLPMIGTSLLPHGLSLWLVLPVTTLLFVFMSGRMIPGMAILTSAADPRLRGTFMTLNSSVQSAAMGVAAYVGGSLISRDAHGMMQHYWMAALVGATASLTAMVLVGMIRTDGQPRQPIEKAGAEPADSL